MKNIVVLNGPRNLSPFVRNVISIINADAIMWMDDFDQNVEYEKGIRNIPYGTKLDKNITLYVFDIFLTPTLLVLKKYASSRKVFVQHGAFSDLLVEQRQRRRNFEWLRRSLINACRFLRIFGFKIETLKILLKIFRFGPWYARKEIANLKLEIDCGVFWSKKEFDSILAADFITIKKWILCKSPDFSTLKLQFSINGKVIYVGQPLVEDALVDLLEYQNFLSNLHQKYGDDLVFIAHPRQLVKYVDDAIRLSDINNPIFTRLVIGHFSSLLLSIPDNIPIAYECFNNDEIFSYARHIQDSIVQTPLNLEDFDKALVRACTL